MSTSVIFEADHMLVAGRRIPIRDVGAHGEMQVGGVGGPILRPLSYGERTRIVLRAVGSRHAIDSVSGAVLRAALVQAGECERLSAEILALVLAGAERDAPTFAETALTVARAARWSLRQINEAEADEIDRFVIALGGTATARADDGWHRIVFADAAAATSLADARRDLVERLIARAEICPASPPVPGAASRYGGGPDATVDAQGDVDVPGMVSYQTDASNSVGAASSDAGAATSPAPQPHMHGPWPDFGGAERDTGDPLAVPHPHREGQGMRADGPSLQPAPIPGTRAPMLPVPDSRIQNWRARAHTKPQALLEASPSSAADDLPGHGRRTTGTRERPPVNRVHYHPDGKATRVIRGHAAAAAPGGGMRGEAHPSELAPRSTPGVLPLDLSATGQRGDAHIGVLPGVPNARPDAGASQVTERVSTLAQLAQLVEDEVADALAALLQHEADLRGIEP